jgi:cardiolipin synthase
LQLLPHVLTLLRLLASPFLAWFIIDGRFGAALWTVVFAGVTDWLDGYTARKLGAIGDLGTFLDPMADKLMLVTLFFALTYAGLIHLWVFALVMIRDLVIVTGSLLLRIYRDVRKFRPVTVGKVSTFFQIVFVLLVLLHAAFPLAFILWLEWTALALTVLFTTWSGVRYVLIGIRLTRRLPV